MPSSVQDLKDELKSLPMPVRAELAQFLIESLDQGEDPAAEGAWEEELDQRVNDIKSGKAKGTPAEEVFAKLRGKST